MNFQDITDLICSLSALGNFSVSTTLVVEVTATHNLEFQKHMAINYYQAVILQLRFNYQAYRQLTVTGLGVHHELGL